MYIYIYIDMVLYIHIYVCLYNYVYIYARVYVYMYVYININMYKCVCMYICNCIRIYTHTYIYRYIYIQNEFLLTFLVTKDSVGFLLGRVLWGGFGQRSIKLKVSFAKEPYKTDDILQKRPVILSILQTVATA